MRKQNEFRCHPPVTSSAGWGAGNNDKREGNEPVEQKTSVYGGGYWRSSAVALLCLVLLAVPNALGASNNNNSKLSPTLQTMVTTGDPSTVVDVIAQYGVAPQQQHVSRVTNRGGSSKQHLPVIQSEAYTVPLSKVPDLVNDPDVSYVSLDNKVKLTGNTSWDPSMQAINADIAAGYGYDGSAVGIAIVDSGIYAHPDLNSNSRYSSSRVVYSQSFVPGDSSTADAYGHGTHVAGLALGNGQSSDNYLYDYTGLAPNANLINLRVLDKNGVGTDSGVIAAINQAISLKSKYNIRVLNLSLGRPVFESYTQDPLCKAVEKAWSAGIVVVVAAGNYGRDNSMGTQGYGTITAPGNDPYVITVGAIDADDPNPANDSIASYSSKGPSLIDHIVKPDIVASGNMIVSLLAPNTTLVTSYPTLDVYPCNWSDTVCSARYGNPMYFTLSGTSMAAPMVSGVAALMIQEDSTLTPDLVKARLMKSAFKNFPLHTTVYDTLGNVYQEEGDIFTYGAGVLDAAAALKSTDKGSGSALSPTAVYNSKTKTISLSQTSIKSTSVLWGSSVLWGASVVWSSSEFVGGTSVLWGSSVLWGASTSSESGDDNGCSVLWGASTLVSKTKTMLGLSINDPGDVRRSTTRRN